MGIGEIVPRPYLSVKEAAWWLSCSPGHVRNLLRRGRLKGFRDGGRLKVLAASLDEYAKAEALPTPAAKLPATWGPAMERLL